MANVWEVFKYRASCMSVPYLPYMHTGIHTSCMLSCHVALICLLLAHILSKTGNPESPWKHYCFKTYINNVCWRVFLRFRLNTERRHIVATMATTAADSQWVGCEWLFDPSKWTPAEGKEEGRNGSWVINEQDELVLVPPSKKVSKPRKSRRSRKLTTQS